MQGERSERPLPGKGQIEAEVRHMSTRAWAMLPSTLLHRESPTRGCFGTHSRPPTRRTDAHRVDSVRMAYPRVTEVTKLPTQLSMNILSSASYSDTFSR